MKNGLQMLPNSSIIWEMRFINYNLSAILDLYDRRIVSFVIRDRNDNALVFDTFEQAVASNPEAHPLFHSDRGYQYTNRSSMLN